MGTAFMVFGLLNVLTGIFVDSAMDVLANDKDNMIQSQMEERWNLVNAITAVFRRSDTDGSGFVAAQEMDLLLQDPELLAYFSAIGLDIDEAKDFFQKLDTDGSGAVSFDEFVTGFLRLKGSAKAVDIVTMMYENRKLSTNLKNLLHDVKALKQEVTQQGVIVQAFNRQTSVGGLRELAGKSGFKKFSCKTSV